MAKRTAYHAAEYATAARSERRRNLNQTMIRTDHPHSQPATNRGEPKAEGHRHQELASSA